MSRPTPAHTPGPWEVRLRQGNFGFEVRSIAPGLRVQTLYDVSLRPALAVNGDGSVTATIAYESWVQFPEEDWHPTQEANARRIVECVNALESFSDPSAAKDLLEAAKAALSAVASHDLYHALHTAIAKAEGTA